MKRWLLLMLAVVVLLAGCASGRTDATREEVVAAYEEAGYVVSSRVYDEKLEHGQIAYVQADHPNGDYIYFVFFETEAEAAAYKEEFYHPGMMGLFSAIFGDPSWQRWELHGCIVAEYDDPAFYHVFEKLLGLK